MNARKIGGQMYKIELTRGPGWNPPVVETHSVPATKHIAEVERIAQRLLAAARPRDRGPDAYRVADKSGRRLVGGTS